MSLVPSIKNPNLITAVIITPEETDSEQWARIQQIYEQVVETLIVCWLTIQYYVESSLFRPTADATTDLFKDGEEVIVLTQNRGKLEDISEYARNRMNPPEDSLTTKHLETLAERFGLAPKNREDAYLSVTPFGTVGNCFGASVLFSEKVLEGGLTAENIKKAASAFEDGIPMQGVT